MENPKIELQQNSSKKCLKFTFEQRLTEQDAKSAIESWQNAFSSNPNDKFIMIWDCIKMTGYDSGARIIWQDALKKMKNQIECIWLITNSSLIKMGASVMSVFASYPLIVVGSEQEIKLN